MAPSPADAHAAVSGLLPARGDVLQVVRLPCSHRRPRCHGDGHVEFHEQGQPQGDVAARLASYSPSMAWDAMDDTVRRALPSVGSLHVGSLVAEVDNLTIVGHLINERNQLLFH